MLALVKHELGVAAIYAFSVADIDRSDSAVVPIAEPTELQTDVARRMDTGATSFAGDFVRRLRQIMLDVTV